MFLNRTQRMRRQKMFLRKRCNKRMKQWEQRRRKRCQRTNRIAVVANYYYIHWRSLEYKMSKLELNR